jgi:hypothetical protein
MNIPPTLAELFQLAFGPEWRRRAPAVFGRSRRQIGRWCSGQTRIPRCFLIRLQRRLPDDVAAVEAWRRDEHWRVDQAAQARHGDLCQGAQWLRAMLFDRPEWEAPPRAGRPRKRPR